MFHTYYHLIGFLFRHLNWYYIPMINSGLFVEKKEKFCCMVRLTQWSLDYSVYFRFVHVLYLYLYDYDMIFVKKKIFIWYDIDIQIASVFNSLESLIGNYICLTHYTCGRQNNPNQLVNSSKLDLIIDSWTWLMN
jgi:hypothetical protein